MKANAKVAENLFRKATSDGRESVIAAIFWLKTRAGWKETTVQELQANSQVVFRTIVETLPPPEANVLDLRPVNEPAYPWDKA